MTSPDNQVGHTDRLDHLLHTIQRHTQFNHPVSGFRLLETHISYVLLTGQYAYKFKKPVNLGFLDFTSLEKRKFYCEEEIRLNRRFAPEIYLDVVAVTAPEHQPALNGEGEVLEYAVKMLQFPEGAELDKVLAGGQLVSAHIDELTREIAAFHVLAAIASADSPYGDPDHIRRPALENLAVIKASAMSEYSTELGELEQWTIRELEKHASYFSARKQAGYIRECHGDLHLGNIALYKGKPVLFDCIEFSAELRWIDVFSEIAFLVMDLDARGEAFFARRLLNLYLEITGDYEGLKLLRFYTVYRALVRCKIACIRLREALSSADKQRESGRARHYLGLTNCYTQPARVALLLTHGLSGSGKTTLTQPVLEALGAVRIRSDIERKRLHGLAARDRSGSGLQAGIYSMQDTEASYDRLLQLAEGILKAGYPVIVDAAFLQVAMRSRFHRLAEDLQIPFVILDFQAREETLRRRVIQREKRADDASEAGLEVLEYQLAHQQPLDQTELRNTIVIDAAGTIEATRRSLPLDRLAGFSKRFIAYT